MTSNPADMSSAASSSALVQAGSRKLHEELLSKEINLQEESPLYTRLPPEIRNRIFVFALTDYEDPVAKYSLQTLYARPSSFATRKSNIELLMTCRAIYHETWFLPFILKEQIHWLTAPDRAPPEYEYDMPKGMKLGERLVEIAKQQGEDKIEIESLQAFAQMYMLEQGSLASLLTTPGLHPRRVTLTLRHTDWWYWEQDDALRVESFWVRDVGRSLSTSTRELRIEMETLERKKDQLDAIVENMCQKWYFRRSDGALLFPDVTGKCIETLRWSGSSTWQDYRWERDETVEDRIDYYVVTVIFQLEPVLRKRGGEVGEEARELASRNLFYNSTLGSAAGTDGEDYQSYYGSDWDAEE